MPANFLTSGVQQPNTATRIEFNTEAQLDMCGWPSPTKTPEATASHEFEDSQLEESEEPAASSPVPSAADVAGSAEARESDIAESLEPSAEVIASDCVMSLEAEPTQKVFLATAVVPVTEDGAGSALVVASGTKETALVGTRQNLATILFEPTTLQNSEPQVVGSEVAPATIDFVPTVVIPTASATSTSDGGGKSGLTKVMWIVGADRRARFDPHRALPRTLPLQPAPPRRRGG